MKVADASTKKAVQEAVRESGGVKETMTRYGFTRNYMPRLYDVLRGTEISPEAEGVIRTLLDLPPLKRKRKEYWRPCVEPSIRDQVEKMMRRAGWTLDELLINAIVAARTNYLEDVGDE